MSADSLRLAVFDLDGTILDTLEDLKDALNYALDVHGMPPRTLDEVRRFVGIGIGLLIKRGVPEGTPEARWRPPWRRASSLYVRKTPSAPG